MSMKLRFSESEIVFWENEYMKDLSEGERNMEQRLIDLKDKVQERKYLKREELFQIAEWKLQAFARFNQAELTLKNCEEEVIEITKKTFTEKKDSLKLKYCVELHGVGEPVGSAILHLFDINKYPILDKHALWSVGLPWEDRTSFPFWLDYVKFCREKATENNVCMRTLDRALWKYSKSIPSRDK